MSLRKGTSSPRQGSRRGSTWRCGSSPGTTARRSPGPRPGTWNPPTCRTIPGGSEPNTLRSRRLSDLEPASGSRCPRGIVPRIQEEFAMSTLPEVRVGEPIRHHALAVFPLASPPDGHVQYLLADEAITAGSVSVEEVSETGSVPNLLVKNQGDSR